MGFAVEVDGGQEPVEPARQPPSAVSEQAHHCGDQGHPDEERIDEDPDSQREAELLDGRRRR